MFAVLVTVLIPLASTIALNDGRSFMITMCYTVLAPLEAAA